MNLNAINDSINDMAWIDGNWGNSQELMVPMQDRGLQLADGIFETVLILNGRPQLLDAHLSRWQASSSLLGMASPPSADWLTPLIHEAIKRCELINSHGALRLNWSRGHSSGRGIALPSSQPDASTHRFWLQLTPAEPAFNPLTALISSCEQRNANSRISQCKTFAYNQSIQARKEAQLAGCDEAILLSTTGELCCGSTANLIVRRQSQWLTPRLSSGCLPGVMRQQGLNQGLLQEAKLEADPEPGDQWLLINSLSCRPITQLNNQLLSPWPDPENLWHCLLNINR